MTFSKQLSILYGYVDSKKCKELELDNQSIYGDHKDEMNKVMHHSVNLIKQGAAIIKEKTGMEPIEHLKSRIKAEDSMREKCRRQNLPQTPESALNSLFDAIGIRIVCSFLDDVYAMRDYIVENVEVVQEKDYIKNVKPNGYRSLHMITRIEGYYVEIQLRTISMDTWAALEHHIRYKKSINANTDLIFEELKRCADELASTDGSMQTIRNLINESN